MIALCMSLLLAQAPTFTDAEAQALFQEANDAYYQADYAQARDKFEKLLASGHGGPDVLMNLGTTYLSLGQLGPAVLELERARAVSSDDDIEAQLQEARRRQGDQIVGADQSEPFLERVARTVEPQKVGVAFLVTWYLGFVLLWLSRRAERRLALGLASAALLLVGTSLGALEAIHASVRTTVVEAVVMPETAKVREFPGANAKVGFEVHAGLKVRVMEETGPWVRVRLPNALEGWTEREGVVPL
jgi:tetratricopeptide (TPR) repeat protein